MAPRFFERPNLLNFLRTGSNTESYQSVGTIEEYDSIIKELKDPEAYEDLLEPFHDLYVEDGAIDRPRNQKRLRRLRGVPFGFFWGPLHHRPVPPYPTSLV